MSEKGKLARFGQLYVDLHSGKSYPLFGHTLQNFGV